MDKKNKGLADTQDGQFILNESGTSVSVDRIEGEDKKKEDKPDDTNAFPEPGSLIGTAAEPKDNTD